MVSGDIRNDWFTKRDNSVKTFFKSSIPLAVQPLGYYGGVIYHEPVFLKKCPCRAEKIRELCLGNVDVQR